MSDIHAGIGSNAPVGTQQFTLFVPSVDRESKPIEQTAWVRGRPQDVWNPVPGRHGLSARAWSAVYPTLG